jgi:starch synthase
MEILHVSAECYPMAKAGGLADVVGALTKYQNDLGHVAKVVMPMHRTKFLLTNQWDVVHKGSLFMGSIYYEFTVIREKTNKLGFELYCVDIYGLLDRESIYSYPDDTERFVAFQIAVLEWMSMWAHRPDIVHVHDHHTALIPFMMHHCYKFGSLAGIKTVLTIHNAQYQGWMGWDKSTYIPAWDTWKAGLLEWNHNINPLACGIKCADRVTTVSPGYMNELKFAANGLEHLFYLEGSKCTGIINGIDYAVWDPLTDTYILDNFSVEDVTSGKELNKKKLCDDFGFNAELPLFVFIGRLVGEKAADLLPVSIAVAYEMLGNKFSFLILGSGEQQVEQQLQALQGSLVGYYNTQITYNEKLSHQMYAGADFLLMPSRVEPCGLNQLYAMRYGTVPVVRRTGGLQDTVKDFGDKDGYGICFNYATVEDIVQSMSRALSLYEDAKKMEEVRLRMMNIETSWEVSAAQYNDLYLSI